MKLTEKELIEKQIEWNQAQQGMWEDLECEAEAAFYASEVERLKKMLA